MRDSDLTLMASILLFIAVLFFVILPEFGNNPYLTTAQRGDKFIEDHMKFGKDKYGNCWVIYPGTSIVSIECSKIGR